MGERPKVVIHTDGACSGNPGPGGWGAILESGSHRKELKGGEPLTTNNRMELTAAIEALEALKAPSEVDLYTDSNYLRGGITSWIKSWKRNGWRTADRKPVKNAELWERLEKASLPHTVRWHWVKGHVGHDANERADELARDGMAPFLPAHRRKNRSIAVPHSEAVMPGLVPGIHVFERMRIVDGRDKPGHDEVSCLIAASRATGARAASRRCSPPRRRASPRH